MFFANRFTDPPYLHASDPSLLDDCLICYRPFAARLSDHRRVKLSCGHKHFCRGCLRKWAREGKNTCPCCRRELWQLEPLSSITSRLANRSTTRQRRNTMIAVQSSTIDTDQLIQTSNAPWLASGSTMFGPSAAMAMSAARMTSFRRNYTPPSTTRDLVATDRSSRNSSSASRTLQQPYHSYDATRRKAPGPRSIYPIPSPHTYQSHWSLDSPAKSLDRARRSGEDRTCNLSILVLPFPTRSRDRKPPYRWDPELLRRWVYYQRE
jgi:hypothetical protein